MNDAPTFMTGGGRLTTGFGTTFAEGRTILIHPDGRIVIAGTAFGGPADFVLARYQPDGSLDATFSVDGKVTTNVFAHDVVSDMALQADGKILVAGWVLGAGVASDFALVRYNVDGSLDTTFGVNGIVITDVLGGDDVAASVSVQTDGRIVVTGDASRDVALVRYNADGSLDTSFAGDGTVTTTFNVLGGDSAASSLIQPDGRIVVAGWVMNDALEMEIALARYNVDGSLDASFGTGGKLTTPIQAGAEAFGVVRQPDGKIVVSGYSDDASGNRDFALARYNADGTLDSTFSGDGIVTTSFGTSAIAYGIVIQPDGRIVVAGFAGDDFALARYESDGDLDTTFDADGKVVTDFLLRHEQGWDLALQPDGRIVVSGFTRGTGTDYEAAVLRYNADGSLDSTFGGVNTVSGTVAYTEDGPPVVLDSSLTLFDTELVAQGHFDGASLVLVRNGGANPQDAFSASGPLGSLVESTNLRYGGVTVGTVADNSGGRLELTFNADATLTRVTGVLQSIAYRNTSEAPPPSVQIDWLFSDGNTGSQGPGGALAAHGSSTVTIAGINDAPTFKIERGRVFVDNFASDAHGVAVRPDGKLVIGGIFGNDFMVMQFNADGSPDTAFGSNGRVTTNVVASDEATDMQLQPDGKILLVGSAADFAGSNRDFVLARYLSDGTLDATFGGDGIIVSDFNGAVTTPDLDAIHNVVVLSDGAIVVAGIADVQAVLARYNGDGTLDVTFDGDGKLITNLGWSFEISLAVQPDGKILAAGQFEDPSPLSGRFSVVRYNTDGSADTTFGVGGKVITPIGATDVPYTMALQSDGKIIVAGATAFTSFGPAEFALVRYHADGSLDTSFDDDGKVTTDFGFDDIVLALAVQSDGKIVAAGSSFNRLAMARYNADGSLDDTFDGDGRVRLDFGLGERVSDVSLQADGKIVVSIVGGGRTVLMRFNTDGSLDSSFGGLEETNPFAPFFFENGAPAQLAPLINIFDAELSAQGHYDGASLTLARHGGANSEDVFSGSINLGPLVTGGALVYSGTTIGTVTENAAGTLALTFNANATQALLESALRSIAYSNWSATPPSLVTIDWLFSDGNTGAQGTGGALSTVVSRNINIVASDIDRYRWTLLDDGEVIAFEPGQDTLEFNTNASAADVLVQDGSVVLAFAGKTVTLQTDLASLTTTNVQFPVTTGMLIVGDNTTGTVNDGLPNSIVGGAGNDHLIGLGGSDELRGAAGADRLDGATGFDRASYIGAPAGVLANLGGSPQNTGDAAGDSYLSIEGLIGSSFSDTLIGDGGVNDFQGLAGDDYLQGHGGIDVLRGGDGSDRLEGGASGDTLDGGAGSDYAAYYYAVAAVTADLQNAALNTGDAAGDSYLSIEGVIGSIRFADILRGDAAANALVGLDGNDQLLGRGGADSLLGMEGHDTLYGGAGADRLSGGAGTDTFVFVAGEANGDAVLDFSGSGAAAGDMLVFAGYGTASAGAAFVQLDATHWRIDSANGFVHDVITLVNGAPVHSTDYSFM